MLKLVCDKCGADMTHKIIAFRYLEEEGVTPENYLPYIHAKIKGITPLSYRHWMTFTEKQRHAITSAGNLLLDFHFSHVRCDDCQHPTLWKRARRWGCGIKRILCPLGA